MLFLTALISKSQICLTCFFSFTPIIERHNKTSELHQRKDSLEYMFY